jgi:hypothetical protein
MDDEVALRKLRAAFDEGGTILAEVVGEFE